MGWEKTEKLEKLEKAKEWKEWMKKLWKVPEEQIGLEDEDFSANLWPVESPAASFVKASMSLDSSPADESPSTDKYATEDGNDTGDAEAELLEIKADLDKANVTITPSNSFSQHLKAWVRLLITHISAMEGVPSHVASTECQLIRHCLLTNGTS